MKRLLKLLPAIKTNIPVFIIGVLCMVLYAAEHWASLTGVDINRWLSYPSSWQSMFENHQYWRLLSPIFIHYSVLHILTNLVVFWIFATPIYWYHRGGFVVLLMVAALISNSIEFIMLDHRFGGLSGVNFALFGFLFSFDRLKPDGPLYVDKSLSIGIFVFLLLSATDWLGNFAFYGHLSGLVVGLIAGWLVTKKTGLS
ncbi:MAG: GlpG protein [Phenylobacterium sp.]